MTYHLGRVAHWIQNKNISYYQTHVIRQLVYQPFAEWIILHVQLFSGTDVFANTIQLFFLASSLSVVTLITKEVGGTAQQQLTSALIAVIVPMVIIQSNTTQNDIVVAFFILSFVFLAIRTLKQTKTSLIFLSGIALGLAWLTKGTAYLFTALFTLWYVLILLKDYRQPLIHILKKAAILAIIPLIAILINSGFYFRNKFLTSSALGDATKITANEGFEAKQIALVTIKNILNHFPVTDHLKEVVVQKAANFDIDANDPRYNFITIEWMKSGFYFHEDYVQNFIQTILIILAGIAFLFKRRLYTQRINYYTLFVFTIFATSILYCVLLKWQPWSNRLQTPLFLLFSVFLAIELSHTKKWMQAICFAAMLGFGIASLLWSTNHPVLPVSHSVIKNSRNSYIYKDGDLECKDYVEKSPFTKIGIYIGGDSWDYPYYRLLANTTTGTRRTIKHVMVNNESAIYLDNFVPDAVLSIDTVTSKYTIYGKDYYKARVFKNGNAIFIPR
ncbi:MAG: glycosyltransferase family 39 protein [Chitinophagaceae bacterium]